MAGRAVSGEQWTIAADGHQATVVAVGGGLREYTVDGEPVLDGYGEDELCPHGAGQVLAPWPNRIRDGRYTFGGRGHQLALTEPARHTASHGLVRWVRWAPVSVEPDAVTVEYTIPPQPGYPYPVRLRTRWSVGAGGQLAEHEATNVGTEPAPFGLGAHPYAIVPGAAVDDLTLHLPARNRLLLDGRLLPIGAARVTGTGYDFTAPRPLRGVRLDTAYGDLIRDPDGTTRVRIQAGDGRGVEVWADGAFSWWQVFTGDAVPGPRQRRSVAIEPMTCPPDAFRSGRDLITLAPDETWQGTWGIRRV